MRSPRPIRLRISLQFGIALCLAVALASPILAEDDFDVRQAQIRLVDGVYRLSAQIDFNLSDNALEALGNGVPLTIVTHIQVRRTEAWMWEDSLLDLQIRNAIRYKPLSENYEVYRLPGSTGRSFVTREAAIRALGELNDLQLVDQKDLDPDEDYEVQLKVFLDIEQLPLPLRPLAYLMPSWKLASGWTKWPITR
ncbi:hypothetical protein ThidrDRAFT_0378 [Thiorhodococcus drewsii AZ1]|uniref:Proline rich signal peptide protein n=1 Tax=Thiorhodococcus drewsii AZ1 TaxID=765913 RepID=G2DWI9_9GAMM|nr:DUF4390 domain-containing protein [Thiorhodococcus drewsii]EGV33689.1 hypothetical protein ThidrDRAFT_0378 [Thiorhodococcus drewsii AZ1]